MKFALKIYTIFLFVIGALFLNFTIDDAFITFRYGKSLVEHGIWNWNPSSENLVEAYTNPLFAVLSIIPHWLDLNVVIFFKVIGVALLYLTYRVLSDNLVEIEKWLCAAFIATNMLIFPHAFSGLETFAFFFTAFYLMTLDDEQLKKPLPSWMILLAPLIRPEGALLSIYIVFRQAVSTRRLSSHAFVAIGFGLAYFFARYHYFGHLFPNTFYAKSGNGFSTFISNFLSEKIVIGGWLIALIFTLKHKGRLLLPIILFLGYLFANLTADLQMNYGYRFAWNMLLPAIFYAFWLAIRNQISESSNDAKVTLPILFVVAFMINFNRDLTSLLTYYPDAIKSHRALGQMLSKYKSSNPILAVGDAGLIPYFSGLNTIDYIGLANSEVAHAIKGRRPAVLPQPDIISVYSDQENSCLPRDFQFKGEAILRKSITTESYSCVPGPRWGNNYYLNFLVKKDFSFYTNFVTEISEVKKYSNGRTKEEQIEEILLFKGLR